jgi:hypothetical protein
MPMRDLAGPKAVPMLDQEHGHGRPYPAQRKGGKSQAGLGGVGYGRPVHVRLLWLRGW